MFDLEPSFFSSSLSRTARSAECHFCCTSFVYYECLHKPRKNQASEDVELQDRFRGVHARREIETFDLDVEDLQEVIVLERRKKVSKGELSSIAFAKKTSQSFLRARKSISVTNEVRVELYRQAQ